MSGQLSQPASSNRDTRNGIVAGMALIAIGALVLFAQYIDFEQFGLFVPLLLGGVFLAWGLISRTFGLIIPGGILSGIGAGAILIEFPFFSLNETAEGGMFLVAFAAGWALISLLSAFVGERFQWWPLIPGGIMAAIGTLLLAGDAGMQILEFAGNLWPLGLLLAGLYLIFRHRKA